MNLIFSADLNWGIGKDNALLIKIPEDMKFFRGRTLGKVVVMGRKTLESLPGSRPLPDRTNIVLSEKGFCAAEGIILCRSVTGLLETLGAYDTEDVFIIGGARIYSLLIPYCEVAYVTKIHAEFDADTHILDFGKDKNWQKTEKLSEGDYDGIYYEILKYERISTQPAGGV